MSFGISHIGFMDDLRTVSNGLRLRLLGGNPPAKLYHYTDVDGVTGIADSRTMRATCVPDLRDTTEVRHGVEMMEAEVRRLRLTGVPPFPQMVLERVAECAKSRISRVFVTCFCANFNSPFHWRRYGDYCLRVETDRMREPLLRPVFGFGSSYLQYYRVIYGTWRQRRAIRTAIRGTVAAIAKNSEGTPAGPWLDSMADFVARDAAELLLDLIVSFKRWKYVLDQEWRLVVRPNVAGSSSPDWDDQHFDANVKQHGNRRFLALQMPLALDTPTISAFERRPIPFSAVYCSPFRNTPSEYKRIRRTLDDNGRSDIPVVKARWPGRLVLPKF